MKRLAAWLPVLVLAGCVASSGGESVGVALGAPADWTLLVYAANDDPSPRLTAGFDADAEEWAMMVGGSRRFRVVVERDYGRRNPGNPASERYVLERGQKLHPQTLEHGSLALGETNTALPGTLSGFLADSIRAFPSRRYWLLVTGHGDNWMGLCADSSDPLGRALPLEGFRTALEDATQGALRDVRDSGVSGSPRLDVVQLDMCRMGSIEVALALEGVADFLVASQENEPSHGHPYGAFYALAQNHTGSSPRTAIGEVVLDYVRGYNPELSTRAGGYVGASITAVAIDLGNLAPLVDALRAVVFAAASTARPSCAQIDAVRAVLSPTAAGDGDRPVASKSAVDLTRLVDTVASDDSFGPEVAREARNVLATIGRPDETRDPNRRYGFIHLTGFGRDSPIVTEAHSLGNPEAAAPAGLSMLFSDPAALYERGVGPAAIDVYRSLVFDQRTGQGGEAGWSSMFNACATELGL